ncbi:hypothetical protein T439DRAFT_320460 [Meredithblackwellia eburnea MCA 4105]
MASSSLFTLTGPSSTTATDSAPAASISKDVKGKGKQTDEQTFLKIPFSVALTLLELSSSSSNKPSDSLVDFLTQNSTRLKNLQDPFPRSNQQKPSSQDGGTKLSDKQIQLVQDIAERFDLNEELARVALQAAADGKDKLDDQDWDSITAYIFEERMAVIAIVSFFLRCHEDTSHPCHSIANTLVTAILSPTFASSLLSSFVLRTHQSLPEQVRQSPSHSLFWAKQLVREQKAILEVVFLVYYAAQPPRGLDILQILDTITQTYWGQRHETVGYFDHETKSLVKELGHLLTLIAVEALNLETAIAVEDPLSSSVSTLGSDDMYHPLQIEKIDGAIQQLVHFDGQRASPILAAWAFILSRVTMSLEAHPAPPKAYELVFSKTLHSEISKSSSSLVLSRPQQPIYQLYATHALATSSGLFANLQSLLTSSLFGPSSSSSPLIATTAEEPNAVGYLSVLRALLTSIPLLVRLPFLSADQYSGLVEAFAKLYGNSAALPLVAQVWDEQTRTAILESGADDSAMLEEGQGADPGSEAEREVIDLAKGRFPVQFRPLVRLIQSLSGGFLSARHFSSLDSSLGGNDSDEEADVAASMARNVFTFLGNLTTLTHVVPSALPGGLGPQPYEVAGYAADGNTVLYRSTRPIKVSSSLIIPTGTEGRLVSEQGRKPLVVAWDVQWSAWRLFGDLLEDVADLTKTQVGGNVGDVFGDSEQGGQRFPVAWENDEDKLADVTSVVEILRIMVTNDPRIGAVLVQHLSSPIDPAEDEPAATPSGPTPTHIVEVLFRLLERALASSRNSIPTPLVSSLLGLIAALLPTTPGVIWTFLRGSASLFPGSLGAKWANDPARLAVLQAEKINGSYPVTLALLSLVRALVLEAQVTECVTNPSHALVKQGVLVRALTWVRDVVWTSMHSWRFVHLGEKYELSKRVVQLYSLVLEQGELLSAKQAALDPVVTVVVEALVTRATITQLAPLLSNIIAGPEPILLLRKALRYSEAQAAEDVAQTSLSLALRLVRYRRRTASGSPPSLLETLCLSPYHGATGDGLAASTGAAGRPDLAYMVAKFIAAPLDPRTASLAAKLLTVLSVSSNEWLSRPASLIALFGGTGKVESLVSEILIVAGEPGTPEILQVAIWDMLSAVVETQPSLAILIVTGKHYPFGPDEAETEKSALTKSTLPEDPSLALAKTIVPPSFRPLPRTAIGIALETVGTWTDTWMPDPALLSSVLCFFDFVWQHLIDYGTALDSFRSGKAFWEAVVAIAFEPVNEPTQETDTKIYCYQMKAKAHAIRILALDVQFALQRPSATSAVSAKLLFESFANRDKLQKALYTAISTSCDSDLHESIVELVRDTFPQVSLPYLRLPSSTHPLDEAREFGTGYLYALPMLRRRLDGCLSDPDTRVDLKDLQDVVASVAALNVNFSLLEAEISNTRAWRQMLEIVLPLLSSSPAAPTVVAVATMVAEHTAEESQSGQIMTTVHEERLSILLTMAQVLQTVSTQKTQDAVVKLIGHLGTIFSSEALPPLDSITRRCNPTFHRTLFRIAYFLFRKLNVYIGVGRPLFTNTQRSDVEVPTDHILRVMVTATRELFLLARSNSSDLEVEKDLGLAVGVISQIVHSPFVPPPSVWLSFFQSVDFFRSAFDVFVHMDLIDGRPLCAQHILDLCLSLASASPLAAEAMALEGAMTALTNNALSAAAEAGAISVVSIEGERTPQHLLWTSMVSLVVSLFSALGDSTRFVEQDVTGFVRLYGSQISTALSWTINSALTLPGIEEMQNTAALVHGIAQRSNAHSPVAPILIEQSLYLLQQVVYAILHPNQLASLVEPVTPEERALLERDASVDLDTAGTLENRPVIASVTLALVQLSRVLVDAVLAYTHSFETLSRDSGEWRTDQAIVFPTSAVTLGDKATIGTLFDIASYCLDTLRQPLKSAVGPTPPPIASSPILPYSAGLLAQNSSQALEGVLTLATTQLALWLQKPDGPATGRLGASSTKTTALMRREITGELTGDLVSLVDKALGLGEGKSEDGAKKKGVRWNDEGSAATTKSSSVVSATEGISSQLLIVLRGFIQTHLGA